MKIKKYIWELVKLFSRKRTLNIKPTMRCNLDCYYCAVNLASIYYPVDYDTPRTYAEQTPEWWIKLIKRAKPSVICISGGEPGLYRGLHKIVNYAIENNILVQILTNLTRVDEYKLIKKSWRVYLLFTLHPKGSMKYYDEMNDRFHVTKRVIKELPDKKTRHEKKMILRKVDNYLIIHNPNGEIFDSCDSSSLGDNRVVTDEYESNK